MDVEDLHIQSKVLSEELKCLMDQGSHKGSDSKVERVRRSLDTFWMRIDRLLTESHEMKMQKLKMRQAEMDNDKRIEIEKIKKSQAEMDNDKQIKLEKLKTRQVELEKNEKETEVELKMRLIEMENETRIEIEKIKTRRGGARNANGDRKT